MFIAGKLLVEPMALNLPHWAWGVNCLRIHFGIAHRQTPPSGNPRASGGPFQADRAPVSADGKELQRIFWRHFGPFPFFIREGINLRLDVGRVEGTLGPPASSTAVCVGLALMVHGIAAEPCVDLFSAKDTREHGHWSVLLPFRDARLRNMTRVMPHTHDGGPRASWMPEPSVFETFNNGMDLSFRSTRQKLPLPIEGTQVLPVR